MSSEKITLTFMKQRCPVWFGPDEMKFFGTRIESAITTLPDGSALFITSDGRGKVSRKYSLRWFSKCNRTGAWKVETTGAGFRAYGTLPHALAALNRMASEY